MTAGEVKVSVALLVDPCEPALLIDPSVLVNVPSDAMAIENKESAIPVWPYEAILNVSPAQPCAVVSRLERVTPVKVKEPEPDTLVNEPRGVRTTEVSHAVA